MKIFEIGGGYLGRTTFVTKANNKKEVEEHLEKIRKKMNNKMEYDFTIMETMTKKEYENDQYFDEDFNDICNIKQFMEGVV